MQYEAAETALKQVAQDHILRFWPKLSDQSRQKLLTQIAALDLSLISQLAESHVRQKPRTEIPTDIQPVDAYPRTPDPKRADLYQRADQLGRQLLATGKVAAFLVAGGQGTRLGYAGPKGEFRVTPIKGKPLFQVFAEQLRAHGRDAKKPIPWFIMTSDANDAATRDFFARHNHFGFNKSDIFFFQQGLMPAFSLQGKLLLAEPDSLALSPDGHGGSLAALSRSGALDDMARRGIEHISYFQVDNPMVHCIDPLFLGLHALTASEMSSKMIPKASPTEKVGNFVSVPAPDGPGSTANGRVVQVIEYSDLPESLAKQTLPDGSPRLNAGSIAIHALTVSFVRRLTAGGRLDLPWHRAEKKVSFVDDKGATIAPKEPNAVKLEQFVFDALPLAKNAIVFTTDRAEEFSPVKNAEGPDSPQTCRRDQIRRAARWLTEAGIAIPQKNNEPDAVIEISPLLATSAPQLKTRNPSLSIPPGAQLYLE
jgi:UDP-N-acetylglucosamine/UDP-N-acetylgalactosamine diphosphorylase